MDIKEYKKQWRLKHRDSINCYNRKWKKTEKGKEADRRNGKKYRERHRTELSAKMRKWMAVHSKSPKIKYAQYKKSAKNMGRDFDLTLIFFTKLLCDDCFYCGVGESMGIDRVKNSKGYVLGNVVPCCEMCNRMKYTFSVDKFIEQCKKIAGRIKK